MNKPETVVTETPVEAVTPVAETVTPVEPVAVQETEPEQPAKLAVEKVTEILGKTKLPKISQSKLSEMEWADEPTLTKAIESEIAYIKELTSSGKPFGMGHTAASEPARMSETERQQALDDIDRRFGLKH